MRFLSIAKIAAGLAVVATVLAACVVVEEGPGPGPGPRPPRPDRPPEMCTREYAPVCGERRGQRETFSNACLARSDGYRVVYGGECRRERPPQRPPEVGCTMQFDPVCAVRGRERRTFGNACSAQVEGYRVVSQGECRGGGGGGGGREERACTREYAPVCGTRRGERRTFGNACEAENARYRIERPGPC